jgi:hypothetical protein
VILASLLLLVAAPPSPAFPVKEQGRGVLPVPLTTEQLEQEGFNAEDAVGLFVGVRLFVGTDQSPPSRVTEVAYAADDAVDLAHLFAVVLRLIKPEKVVLALSGDPQKPKSVERLQHLVAVGARRTDASFINLVSLISRASRGAGKRGLLVMSFATHGYSAGGADGLLAQDSSLETLELTGIPVRVILESASSSDAPRRLILLDACRERVSMGARASSTSPTTSAPVECHSRQPLPSALLECWRVRRS